MISYDPTDGTFGAVDYYISHQAQCDGTSGVCPDEVIGGRNDVVFISGERRDGVTSVTYARPLQTNEAVNDRAIPHRGAVSVIAAVGPLNSKSEAGAHLVGDKTARDDRIDFGGQDNDCALNIFDLADENLTKPYESVKLEGNYLCA